VALGVITAFLRNRVAFAVKTISSKLLTDAVFIEKKPVRNFL
jgi:hypothetical protein